MKRPTIINQILFKRAKFNRLHMEVNGVKNVPRIIVNLNVVSQPFEQDSDKENQRTILFKLIMKGVKETTEDEKPETELPVFVFESTLECLFEKNMKSKSRKNIDELIAETFWYYGPQMYQVIRSRMLLTLREHAIDFIPPIDLDFNELVYDYNESRE